jgi:SAM-dependent methyltransferase
VPRSTVASESGSTAQGVTSVWRAPIGGLDRLRLWRQGARRVRLGWIGYDDITPLLQDQGVEVVPYRIDVAAFWRFVDECGYRQMDYWHGGKMRAAVEKWLEHFVSIELLQPAPGQVVVDVASCTSPFPDLVRRRLGCVAYRQDWSYAVGIDGDRIGGDAVRMPVPDGFADHLVLHCSFEHFEGERDSLFLREAERVLRPGGKLCILPVYTSARYGIQTDLAAWNRRRPELARRALTCIAEGWGEVHGRFYDLASFRERILRHLGGLRLQVWRVENCREVAPDCYLQMAAVFTRA